DDDAVGAVARNLGDHALGVAPEDERDALAAELSGELAALADQLERDPRGAAGARLHERPTVVALRGRALAEPLGLRPIGRLDLPFRQELTDSCDRIVERCEDLSAAIGRHIPNC